MNGRSFIFPLLSLVLLLSACSKPDQAVSAKEVIDYYTCTMHPWIHSKKPGTCPVCGMDLVPVYANKSQPEKVSQKVIPGGKPATSSESTLPPRSHDFEIPVERQQQFGVTY